MRACRNETSGVVAGTSVSARGLALAAGMLTVMGVGGAGVSPAQGGIVVSSIGFGFSSGDCWGDDSLRVRVSSFNSWCDEWVHRRVAWDCGPSSGSWGYRPWGYRWNSHVVARRSWYEPCDIVVGDSWRWWRDPVADVYVYRPVVIAPSRPVLLPYEPSRVVAADVDGDGYIDEGESAVLVPTAPVYVGAPVVWGPAPVVVYRTYRPWCPPRYYDDCYRRPIYSSVTVCDDDWWGSTRVSVSITIGLGSRSWNHWNRWDRCDDWRRWDDRWCGPVHGPRRDQVTINNPVFNGPVYFNGNTNVNGGIFAPNGPTQIAAGPVIAPAVVPAVVTVRESKESGRGERRSGLARVDELGSPIAEGRGGAERGGVERIGAPRLGGGEASREGLRDGVRDGRRAEGSKILTGDEAAAVGRTDRVDHIDRTDRSGRTAGLGERSASRGDARVGESVENNEPKRPARADDARRAERGGDERKPSVMPVTPVQGEVEKRPTSIATRDSRDEVRGRGVPSVRETGKREADAREGESMPRGVGRADRAGDTAKGEVNGERGAGEVTTRRGVVEAPGRGVGDVDGQRRAEMKPTERTTARPTERAVAPAEVRPETKPEVKPEALPEVREAVKPTARGTRPAMSERGGEAEGRDVRMPRGGAGSTQAPAAGPSVNPVTTRQPRVMQPVLTSEPTEVKAPAATERAPRERSREVDGGGVRREMPTRAEPRVQPRTEPRSEPQVAPRAEKPSAAPASAGIPVPANTGRGERKIEAPTGNDGGRGEARVVSPRRTTTTTTTDGAGVVRETKPSAPAAGPKADPGSIPGVTPTTPARQRVRAPIGGGGSADQGGRSEATKPTVVSPSRVQQPDVMPGMMPGQGDEGKKPSSRGMGERRSGYGGGVQVGGGSGSESKPGRTSSAGARSQPSPPAAQPPQRQVQPQVQAQARPAAPAPASAPAPRAAPAPAPSQPASAPSKGSGGEGGGGESKGGGERKRG